MATSKRGKKPGGKPAAGLAGRPELGPRGGHTTRKDGRVKKTVWLHEDEAESVRDAAYEQYRSEASIIREAIRKYLHIED
ncbi:MAG: hypothetical protein OES32_13625 [Acidobacteriota bacterium]|nr:hypothetical protein [Acidobacteriota bacterium]MDH3524618.1 hypothetical protein [Acidobacteriota bacterium]